MDLRTGAAFWLLKNGLLATFPSLDRDEAVDVAVIGAGITGALVAHRLTTAGANVVVLDKRDVASGSTAATTGLLQYETDTSLDELSRSIGEEAAARVYSLGLGAIDAIEELCREVGDGCGFERKPSLYLASTTRDVEPLQRERALRARRGFDVEWLSPYDLRARYGIDRPGAISSVGEGQIDCYRLTSRVLQSAATRGACVYDRTTVTRVDADGDGVMLRTDREAVVRAKRVVWAAGYETTTELRRHAGRRHSTWAFVSEPVRDFGCWSDRALIWETARPYLYARSTDDGRIMVGGEDEPFSSRHQDRRLLESKTTKLVERFAQLFPSIDLEVAYRWAGVFTTTRDGLPYIGTSARHPNAWLALGYGGNGITFSMIAADLIRDAWLGYDNSDARIFALDRPTRPTRRSLRALAWPVRTLLGVGPKEEP